MRLLIKKGLMITPDGKQYASIIINNEKIVDIVRAEQEINENNFDDIINAENKIIMPGLFNGHIHSYGNLVKGFTPTIPLEGWMLYIMAQGGLMDAEDCYWNAMLGAVEMIKSGTIGCIDHLSQPFENLDYAMQAYQDIGLRCVMAPMVGDKSYFSSLAIDHCRVDPAYLGYNGPDYTAIISMIDKLLHKRHDPTGLLQVGFGPSGPQRCSDELLIACANKAKEHDTIVHTHILETQGQTLAAQMLYGNLMLQHLQNLGILSERFSFAHGVFLTDEEIKIAAAHGSILIHNPAVNYLLGSGVAPVDRYRHLNARVALGTDGANGSGNLNMFESIKDAAIIHNPATMQQGRSESLITPQEALRMATMDSAAAANLQGVSGVLQAGCAADLIIINPALSPRLSPMVEPLWQIVYSCPDNAVETVVIRGKKVMENGQITFVSEQKVREECHKRAKNLQQRFQQTRLADVKQMEQAINFASDQ